MLAAPGPPEEIGIALPEHDWAAWRMVLLGMRLLHISAVAFVFGLVAAIFTCCLIIGAPPGAGSWVGWTFGLFCLCILLAMYLGLGLCCWSPRESGARPFAQGTLALAVAAAVVVIVPTALVSSGLTLWLDMGEITDALGFTWYGVILVDWGLMFGCWLYFVRAVALHFNFLDLAARASATLPWAAVWFGCIAMTPIVAIVAHSTLAVVLLAMVIFGLTPPLAVWSIHLLIELRESIEIVPRHSHSDLAQPGRVQHLEPSEHGKLPPDSTRRDQDGVEVQ